MNRRSLLLLFIVTLGAGWAQVACLFLKSHARFVTLGVVVDAEGRALSDVTVKTRFLSAVSDERGCFYTSEPTHTHSHELPFSVAASGFKPFAGTLGAPGLVHIRVVLAEVTSNAETVVDSSLEHGDLGVCECPPGEADCEGGIDATRLSDAVALGAHARSGVLF